jgi:hypothetical protein
MASNSACLFGGCGTVAAAVEAVSAGGLLSKFPAAAGAEGDGDGESCCSISHPESSNNAAVNPTVRHARESVETVPLRRTAAVTRLKQGVDGRRRLRTRARLASVFIPFSKK